MKTVTILLDNEIYEKLLLEAVRKKKTPDKLRADKLTSLVFLSKFYCQAREMNSIVRFKIIERFVTGTEPETIAIPGIKFGSFEPRRGERNSINVYIAKIYKALFIRSVICYAKEQQPEALRDSDKPQ
jgi:hypothetical protein